MTSTLLDATLFLLLVSAGVVTVSTAGPAGGPTPPDAAAAAETLATSTATVNYTLAPGARRADGSTVEFRRTDGPEFRRTSHGTLVALVADAALGRVTVGDERLTHTRDDLAAAVRRAVTTAVGRTHTQVVAVWRPYPDAPVDARLTVGERPSERTNVRAAAVVASSGSPPGTARRVASAADHGYRRLAAVTARLTVRTLFPPQAMRFALGADYPVSALVRHRYLRAGRLLGVDVHDDLERHDVRGVNRRLARALADRFERDLRRRYDSPAAAADAVDVARVRVVVRRWSA